VSPAPFRFDRFTGSTGGTFVSSYLGS
jgi:hypothetical protein